MGLIERVGRDGKGRYAILSDIQGMEDSATWTSRVTGTPDGITKISDGYQEPWSIPEIHP